MEEEVRKVVFTEKFKSLELTTQLGWKSMKKSRSHPTGVKGRYIFMYEIRTGVVCTCREQLSSKARPNTIATGVRPMQ